MISIGAKRTRITIQRPVDTRDSFGGVTRSWLDVHSCWAELLGLSGREQIAAQQAGAILTHRVRMDYVSGLAPTMRLKCGNRILNIGAVIEPDQKKKVHECLVTEDIGV